MIVDIKDRFYRSGRDGATLIEVLVAIFIMGIGLMALLVLFPLGALRMAAAIQSDRAAQAAVAAGGIAAVKDIRRDPGLTPDSIYDPSAGKTGDHFLNPVGTPTLADADLERSSYPLLIDPVGYFTAAGLASQKAVAGFTGANLLLARRPVSFTPPVAGPTAVYRWFTSQDDIIFDKDGSAKSVVAGAFERDVRYSYAYLLNRPRTADPSVVECAVIVYSGRAVGLSGNLDLGERAYFQFDVATGTSEVVLTPAANTIRINYGIGTLPTNAPPMRAGDWLLDVSVVPQSDGTKIRHAFFNRIAGVTEGTTFVEYEMQNPLRGFGTFPTNPNCSLTVGNGVRILFLEGVAEVFERGLGKEPASNP